MIESVSEVLATRARREERLTTMVLGSAVAHVVVIAAVAFLSARVESAPPPKVFMVSFSGGAPGPVTGGMTSLGGRAIEKVAPPEPPKAVERPPAPTPPKMTLPAPAAKPKPKPEPSKATNRPAESAIPAPPTTGEEVRAGSTKIDTGVKGPGFGLSTSTGGVGGPVLEVSDFCCPEYIQKVVSLISANWDLSQQVPRPVVIRFTIQRDGTIEDAMVKQSSGVPVLDFNARRAVQLSSLPRLPDKFTNPTLTVNLTFKQGSQ